jgi:hypothetical protein
MSGETRAREPVVVADKPIEAPPLAQVYCTFFNSPVVGLRCDVYKDVKSRDMAAKSVADIVTVYPFTLRLIPAEGEAGAELTDEVIERAAEKARYVYFGHSHCDKCPWIALERHEKDTWRIVARAAIEEARRAP